MTNEKIKIEDEYLISVEFYKIQSIMLKTENFPWFYSDGIDVYQSNDDLYKFQFTHTFYRDSAPNSDSISIISPILNLIRPVALSRIKANLLTRTPKIIQNTFHCDLGGFSEERLSQWTTSIFYMNTNNGYTIFEDGTKVESVANRMLTFPSNMKHTGTSCTDEKVRIVINFNYV